MKGVAGFMKPTVGRVYPSPQPRLRLVAGRNTASASSALAPSKSPKEDKEEEVRELVDNYIAGVLPRNSLYSKLRELLGTQVFEWTRKSHENMVYRGASAYADLSPELRDFPAFLASVGPRYRRELTLDRIDGDRGYEVGNLRWADKQTQTQNRKNTVRLTSGGVTRTLAEWASLLGVTSALLHGRRAKGWTDEEIVAGHQQVVAPGTRNWPPKTGAQFEVAVRDAHKWTIADRLELVGLLEREMNRLSLHASDLIPPVPEEELSDKQLAESQRLSKIYGRLNRPGF